MLSLVLIKWRLILQILILHASTGSILLDASGARQALQWAPKDMTSTKLIEPNFSKLTAEAGLSRFTAEPQRSLSKRGGF